MARVLTITLNPAIDLSFGLELLQPGDVNRAHSSHTRAGGKGNNVARVLAAHGHDVTVTGFLGVDNADLFATVFAQLGMTDTFVRVPGATRTNVKLAEAASRVSDINAPGQTIAADDVRRLVHTLEHVLTQPFDAVVVAGSLPPGLSSTALRAVLAPVMAAGVPLWLDTSGDALVCGLTQAPALVKPNVSELGAWAGSDPATPNARLAAARAMQDQGAAEVAVSCGGEGVLWLTRQQVLTATAPAVAVENTVCAGDTLLAGLLHGRLSGWTDADTLAFAVALSADAVTRIGVGRSDTPDFARLRHAVAVELIDDQILVD